MTSAIIILFADLILQSQSLFVTGIASGRKKRQDSNSNSSITDPAPLFEELNFTDAQREICNNIMACLYDLAVTGDLEVANISRETSENTTILQALISELKSHDSCMV